VWLTSVKAVFFALRDLNSPAYTGVNYLLPKNNESSEEVGNFVRLSEDQLTRELASMKGWETDFPKAIIFLTRDMWKPYL
jgi:hypothetical protein